MEKKWEMLVGPFQLNQDDIETSLSISSYTLSSLDLQVRDYEVRQKIKEMWLKALEKNPRLKPGLKFMLNSLQLEHDKDKPFVQGESLSSLRLGLGITDYGIFVATNGVAKENSDFAMYLMQQGKKNYGNEFEYFASPIGNCAVVESSDNRIALIKRADTMYEYPGFYDTPGGHPEPLKHSSDSKGQFDAIIDEVSEEIKIPKGSIEEAQLMGIAHNLENFRKPDLLFYLRTGLHSSKMATSEEVSGLEKLSKDELFEHWKKGTYQIVPPSEALLFAYYYLQQNYDLSFLEK